MASLVDAIRGSGPVMRRPSMDRRAFGLSFIFGCQRRAGLELHTETTLERSPSVPPRGDWFRFGHDQCAAVRLEHQPNKKCPHGSRLRLGELHMRAMIDVWFTSNRTLTTTAFLIRQTINCDTVLPFRRPIRI